MKHIAIFASGAGSNAARIIDHFHQHPAARVSLVVCNNPKAGVLKIAADANLPVLLVDKATFFDATSIITQLRAYDTDLIVLAGFLWKLPPVLVDAYPRKIINIHPALLPAYGGKGMYGQKVHQAVLDDKVKESGISIHYVDEVYDNGDVIFQATCEVHPGDTSESLAQRIHMLEHQYYSQVIEGLLTDR